MTSVVLHLKAKNDVNGNPRRLFVLLEDGKVKKVVNEGYEGMPEEFSAFPTVSINVETKEYRKWKKMM